jgi:hypothetical protein
MAALAMVQKLQVLHCCHIGRHGLLVHQNQHQPQEQIKPSRISSPSLSLPPLAWRLQEALHRIQPLSLPPLAGRQPLHSTSHWLAWPCCICQLSAEPQGQAAPNLGGIRRMPPAHLQCLLLRMPPPTNSKSPFNGTPPLLSPLLTVTLT